ncbi:MAG: glycoside hydrolase family 99-like domain-containing protein [Melioribacteraceae bacterium]|nr:glycoside hydrolase family 99-like domain-containing protein [Melioribacteraceae bacterium]
MKILKKIEQILYFFIALLFLISASKTEAQETKIFVHYMPWYQTPTISGYWGWHWTMGHFNPSVVIDGKRQIASQYYPVTGPYDSQDPLLLEYQVLLMKLSGIDGVIVDWYGIEDYNDYKILNESTNALFEYIKSANLEFSICYEDQSIKHMVNAGRFPASQAVSKAQEVMSYMQTNWFNDPAYAKLNGNPLLMIFGPQYFNSSSEWTNIFSVLDNEPVFITLDNRLAPVAEGAYPWPPMWKSENGVLSRSSLQVYLNDFYSKSASWDFLISSAFPGFHDIYEEAGLHDSYGYLDAEDGEIFQLTLDQAVSRNPDVIQIVTWNDYGEGTIVEPTIEFGTKYLEMIQQTKNVILDSNFAYTAEDLQMPYEIWDLRRRNKSDVELNAALDDIFNLIANDQLPVAKAKLDSILNPTSVVNESLFNPIKFKLSNTYPNPFNPETTFQLSVPEDSEISVKIFDVLGNEVAKIASGHFSSGEYRFSWVASEETSGIYFVKAESNGYFESKKIILMK